MRMETLTDVGKKSFSLVTVDNMYESTLNPARAKVPDFARKGTLQWRRRMLVA